MVFKRGMEIQERICFMAIWMLQLQSVSSSPIEVPQYISRDVQTYISDTFEGDGFSFLISGDNGGFPEPFYSTQVQRGVAAAMANQSTEYNCKFILELGDNFYFRGVKDIFDTRFRGTFEEVYHYPSLYIPWYITTGNHDWEGSVQAQIDYTKISTRWTFPWYWYTLDHTLEPSGTKIRIIMFETTIPCGIAAIDIDGIPIDESMAEEQWAWLEKELQDGQDADYLIVTGHYPIYSAAATGPEIKCLKDRLDPLLQRYGVSAYISGHEHSAQYLLANNGSPVKYVIIGCSNFVGPFFPFQSSDIFKTEFLFASWRDLLTGCFARVDVTAQHLNIKILEGKEGEELYTITIPSRGQ